MTACRLCHLWKKLPMLFFSLLFIASNFVVFAFEDVVVGGVEKRVSSVTVVSGHWVLEKSESKHPIGSYHKWYEWKNALSINANLMFYTDSEEVSQMVLDIRGKRAATTIKYRNISTMKSRFSDFKAEWISRRDVPSKEIGVIWLDKIFMIQDAILANPYQSDWFAWHDAGNAYYRNTPIRLTPWPSTQGLKTLPKDKFIYTSSWYPITDHCVAGSAFMLHKQIISQLIEYFWVPYKTCFDNKCGSDQILFSRIKDLHPDFFYQVGYGYGILIEKLFMNNPLETHIHNRSQVCAKDSGIVADIFQIMKNTEKKDPRKGFLALCKSLWRVEYPAWKEDYKNYLQEEAKRKDAKIARQRFNQKITGKGNLRASDRWQ